MIVPESGVSAAGGDASLHSGSSGDVHFASADPPYKIAKASNENTTRGDLMTQALRQIQLLWNNPTAKFTTTLTREQRMVDAETMNTVPELVVGRIHHTNTKPRTRPNATENV